MWKRPSNPDEWQQVVYAVSHKLPGPVRRIVRQEVFWQWLYPVWWKYKVRWLFSTPAQHLGTNRYITIVPGPDGGTAGIGDQLSKWNTALVLALKYDLRLAHHPFVRWWSETQWDEFLGFGVGEKSYAEVMHDPTLRKIWLPPLDLKHKRTQREKFVATVITKLYPQDNIMFHLGDGTNLYDHSSTANWLKRKYWQARAKQPLPRPRLRQGYGGQAGAVVIALHVRRGDLVDMKKSNTKVWQQRWLDHDYFVRIVEQVREELGNTSSEIHVYSEGTPADFPEFQAWPDIIWHLNEDLKKTWHGFVTADVLIISPSSLSYHAGFLCEGVKIAVYPWWHYIPDSGGWVRSTRAGTLDKSALKESLRALHLNA